MFSQFVLILKSKIKRAYSPFGQHEISVLIELTLGHLRYHLTDVPPQPNSPPDYVLCTNHPEQAPSLSLKPAVTRDFA